ncbi:MAG: TetR/AcrR family transcriptional regulator [Candidatus Heimdallarchaeota archaeon]|nr:TetR/AcrR family transcriptional regulator [Candidatus Heimdallarchaeota archaeon]
MSTKSRREREKLKRHNDIIEAAQKRFFEKGYDEVSMDEIAGDLELSKATLYLYFKNKQSLYFAVVIKGMIILRDTFKIAVEKESTGLKKILGIAQSFFEYMQLYSNYYLLNLSARGKRFANMLYNNEIDNAEFYLGLTVELLNLLKDVVSIGVEDGTLRKDLDPLQTTMFLGVAIEAAVQVTPEYQILLQQFNLTKEGYFQHSINVLLQGIAGSKQKYN